MTDKVGRPSFCGQCGGSLEDGDRFCGVCGARIPPDAQDASPTQDIPTLVQPPPVVTTSRRSRSRIVAAVLGVLLVFLLGAVGAMAFSGLGSGGGLLGGTQEDPAPPQPSGESPGSPQRTTFSSTPSEPSWMSDEEIAALEEFGRDYDEAMRRGAWEETYSMLDEESQQEFTEQEWAEKQQTLVETTGLPAPLESVGVEQEEQVADGPVILRLSYADGTEETMTVLIPMVVEDPSDSGVPKRLLTDEEISELGLSSAAPPTESDASSSPQPRSEDELRSAVEDYYWAVDREDWDYTYEHLDSATRAGFTREEWFQKNGYYETIDSLDVTSMDVQINGSTTDPVVSVTVYRTFEDGTSLGRDTFFLYEHGEWKHRFGQEENELYMPGTSYEEFVAAQGGSASASAQ